MSRHMKHMSRQDIINLKFLARFNYVNNFNDLGKIKPNVTPQNLRHGHDGHFTPQARRLKVETAQTFIL